MSVTVEMHNTGDSDMKANLILPKPDLSGLSMSFRLTLAQSQRGLCANIQLGAPLKE